jgi:hypothetical protein
MPAGERTPLLDGNSDPNGDTTVAKVPAIALGPLEISAANRRSILAGIWIATFLSVGFFFFHVAC